MYTVSKGDVRATVSGTEFGRTMKDIFEGSDSVSTMIFPSMVRTIWQDSFHGVKSLKSVVLNEGLETLGTDECKLNRDKCFGVFEKSGLKRVRLPSTLRRIEYNAFLGCKNLKSINLPGRLEYIGKCCFQESGLELVNLPHGVKIIDESAFYQCENLKSVVLPAGLEKIRCFAFFKTNLESIKFPESLREIAQGAFA